MLLCYFSRTLKRHASPLPAPPRLDQLIRAFCAFLYPACHTLLALSPRRSLWTSFLQPAVSALACGGQDDALSPPGENPHPNPQNPWMGDPTWQSCVNFLNLQVGDDLDYPNGPALITGVLRSKRGRQGVRCGKPPTSHHRWLSRRGGVCELRNTAATRSWEDEGRDSPWSLRKEPALPMARL